MKNTLISCSQRRLTVCSWIARIALIVAALATGLANVAQSGGIAYDPFNYSPAGSPVAGDGGNGSFGFSSTWYGDGSFTVAASNLPSPVPLPASISNSVTAAAFGANRNLSRDLTQPLGADNTTAFFSFVMEPQGTVGDGAFEGWFGFALLAGARNIVVGKDSFHGTFSLTDNLGDPSVETNIPVVSGQSHLFVLETDFHPGNDTYKLYIDPATGQPQPATPAATLDFDLQTIPTIGFAGPGAFGFDELRIGTTWADVTPTPEPESAILASAGFLLLVVLRIYRARRRLVRVYARHTLSG